MWLQPVEEAVMGALSGGFERGLTKTDTTNTKVVPLMLLAMTSYGVFAFCAAVCFLGLVRVWIFVPELAGRSLESTDELFALPWYDKDTIVVNVYSTCIASLY